MVYVYRIYSKTCRDYFYVIFSDKDMFDDFGNKFKGVLEAFDVSIQYEIDQNYDAEHRKIIQNSLDEKGYYIDPVMTLVFDIYK